MRWEECGVWSVQFQVWPLERKVSQNVELQRGRAQVLLLDNNSAAGSRKARTHGPKWRAGHASSIDEKGPLV
jgi:hypothetical protein